MQCNVQTYWLVQEAHNAFQVQELASQAKLTCACARLRGRNVHWMAHWEHLLACKAIGINPYASFYKVADCSKTFIMIDCEYAPSTV
eukprot:894113-Pelagomonas_calceolata.AAC.2